MIEAFQISLYNHYRKCLCGKISTHLWFCVQTLEGLNIHRINCLLSSSNSLNKFDVCQELPSTGSVQAWHRVMVTKCFYILHANTMIVK